jgi:hypothetical protein
LLEGAILAKQAFGLLVDLEALVYTFGVDGGRLGHVILLGWSSG